MAIALRDDVNSAASTGTVNVLNKSNTTASTGRADQRAARESKEMWIPWSNAQGTLARTNQ